MKKKLLALLVSVSLCLSLSLPAVAASGPTDLDEASLSDAYINFSERLADEGISVQTCLEDFISGYESFYGHSVQQYIDTLVEYETALAPHLELAIYRNLQIAAEAPARSARGQWYDNIGESNPALPQAASYDTYDILSTVKKGDIIHETSGGVASLVGHIAVVEGKYWDSTYRQYYIRTVEATLPTVTHGVLDDSRYDYRGVDIYYVTDATSTEKRAAVNFIISQLGKPWSLEMPLLSQCSYSSDTESWYCSELAWAAYYNQDINLHGSSIPRHIYTPAALASSSELTYRDVE